ncbi:hypothetical protein ACFLZV_00690, partial [Candidatus Margulisiibacteriota bacterium]
MKKLFCVKIPGALYQPNKPLKVDDYCIYPFGIQNNNRVFNKEACIILGFSESCDSVRVKKKIHLIISCLQFLFPVPKMTIYHLFNACEYFSIDYTNENEIHQILANKYNIEMSMLSEYPKIYKYNFDNLTTKQTSLPENINFSNFHKIFKERFSSKKGDALRLYLHALGNTDPIYNNIFHQITLLQIVFESLIGKPKNTKCKECNQPRYEEKITEYQLRILKKRYSVE